MTTSSFNLHQLSRLVQLPAELQLEIVSHLGPLDAMSLRLVNKHFHEFVMPLNHDELIEASWAVDLCYRDCCRRFRACGKCLRLRPARRFRNHHVDPDLWCIDCEMTSNERRYYYRKGRVIYTCAHHDRGHLIFCRGCGKVKDAIPNNGYITAGICLSCDADNKARWDGVLTRNRSAVRQHSNE